MEFVGIDKMSLLDYDDMVSCVLFTPKCNFRCPFCHNGLTVLDSEVEIKFEDILTFLKSRVGLIDAVVISGGEPTLMPELKERIKIIRDLGFKIKLDTNGTNPTLLKELVNEHLLDYVAMDIKNSFDMYPITCGVLKVNESRIQESIDFLKENHVDYEFRTTLVEEFHDEKSIKEMGEIIKGAKKLYLQKFVDREGVIQKGLHEVEKKVAVSFKEILLPYVSQVSLRGY